MEKIVIPKQVELIMDMLSEHGYRPYIAGECVRDLLLGREVQDYDIITSAVPERLEVIFEPFRNKKFYPEKGVMVILYKGMAVQVATYRDSENFYTDDVIKDLARREFTMNAIAYSSASGFVDPFGGCGDVANGLPVIKPIIFEEKPSDLETGTDTMFNALMYAGTGEYVLSDEAKSVIENNCRIVTETEPELLKRKLSELLLSRRIADVMEQIPRFFFTIIPELEPMLNFDQHSREQMYDLWIHTAKSVGFSTPDPIMRFALLFHGMGKPDCYAEGAKGYVTFDGYIERSRLLADRVMDRLGFTPAEMDQVDFLIENQDNKIGVEKDEISAALEYYSPAELKSLLLFNMANYRAKSPALEQKAMASKQMSEQVFAINERRARAVPMSLT